MSDDAGAFSRGWTPNSSNIMVSQLQSLCRVAAERLDAGGVGLSLLAHDGTPALTVASD